jgi:endonuclease III
MLLFQPAACIRKPEACSLKNRTFAQTTAMTRKERFEHVISYFREHKPDASTELRYQDPYELAVATILSAQCTDKRVNMITPAFFRRFPDPVSLSGARQEDVFDLIRSCSYPNNKAKNLIGMARALTHDFGGVMPSEVDELLKLPGVGRKTANVLASVLFNKPALAVDTHVHRVSARIGLTVNAKNPLQTEQQLVKHIPADLIPLAHHWLILHGRYVCIARKPNCPECGISAWCRYFEKNTRAELVNKSKAGK